MSRRDPETEAGFLLPEAMLALLVLSAGVFFLFHVAAASERAARMNRDRFQAGLLVENRIWEMKVAGRTGESGPSSDALLGNLSWDVRETVPQNQAWTRREVRVGWGQGKERGSLEMAAYCPR